jgi:hypothetical protein
MDVADASTTGRLTEGLVAVPARGRGVCAICRDLIAPGYARCRHCRRINGLADAVVPVSLCLSGGALHAALRGYKDAMTPAARDDHASQLAAILDRFLELHEPCLAQAATVGGFDTVTVVPSSSPVGDELRPALRDLAGERCGATRSRHVRLLAATGAVSPLRGFDERRYVADADAGGRRIVLLEDTWVTGGRALSAAAALRAAGALAVVVVALGRFINADHGENAKRVAKLPRWSPTVCAAPACLVSGAASV